MASGIYQLNKRFGFDILPQPFVTGWAERRVGWAETEPTKGNYDFTPLAPTLEAVRKTGKKLAYIPGMREPDYPMRDALWIDNDLVPHPVPWSKYLQERWARWVKALAQHIWEGVRFRDLPELAVVGLRIPGLGHIRPQPLYKHPDYTREKFVSAVWRAVNWGMYIFPRQQHYLGLWAVTDNIADPPLWQALLDKLRPEFPRLGLFNENLADNGREGFPKPEFAKALYAAREVTPIHFQALTSWARPFTGEEKVEGGTPMQGMQYALDTYGCRYFEMYSPDLDNPDWAEGWQEWAERLRGGDE